MREDNPTLPNTELCERMLSARNIETAVNNVRRNNGSAGIDGVTVSEIDGYMREHWDRIKVKILARKYKPQPVKRVEIPKDNGGVRLLGIPCVIDRVIQQAMVQVMEPVFEPTFSDYSYGFRPNRSAEDAVRKAQEYMAEGYRHVVDLDLSKFFDTVNHDLLMTFVDRHMPDKDIRRLIFVYLKCGVMTDGNFSASEEGTPQGGPLSPMLSNIYLTPYDKELEKRGLRFVRYADDCNIFTRTGYSSRRVKDSAIRYLENKLKLKVNMEKTEARSVVGSSFLGFTFTSFGRPWKLGTCRPKEKKILKFKKTVTELTKRNRGVSVTTVIRELNAYIRGWVNYYARSNIAKFCINTQGWINRRIRQYLWKQWKTAARRKAMLEKVCCTKWQKRQLDEWKGFSNNNHWHMSKVISFFITNRVLYESYGLIDMRDQWKMMHAERARADENALRWKQPELGLQFA